MTSKVFFSSLLSFFLPPTKRHSFLLGYVFRVDDGSRAASNWFMPRCPCWTARGRNHRWALQAFSTGRLVATRSVPLVRHAFFFGCFDPFSFVATNSQIRQACLSTKSWWIKFAKSGVVLSLKSTINSTSSSPTCCASAQTDQKLNQLLQSLNNSTVGGAMV